jgi:hypothetical protein
MYIFISSSLSALAFNGQAVFKEFGDAEDVPLLVAVGPQPDALEGLAVPGNVLCHAVLPQVELLRLKPAMFVTHCASLGQS